MNLEHLCTTFGCEVTSNALAMYNTINQFGLFFIWNVFIFMWFIRYAYCFKSWYFHFHFPFIIFILLFFFLFFFKLILMIFLMIFLKIFLIRLYLIRFIKYSTFHLFMNHILMMLKFVLSKIIATERLKFTSNPPAKVNTVYKFVLFFKRNVFIDSRYIRFISTLFYILFLLVMYSYMLKEIIIRIWCILTTRCLTFYKIVFFYILRWLVLFSFFLACIVNNISDIHFVMSFILVLYHCLLAVWCKLAVDCLASEFFAI